MAGTIKSEPTPYEKLLLLLPGFKGYKERDIIKQDDQIVRTAIKNNIEVLMKNIQDREADISNNDPFDGSLKIYERILIEIRAFVQELMGAPTGTLNYHDQYKLSKEKLEEILNYDYSLITLSKTLRDFDLNDTQGLLVNLKNARDIFRNRLQLFLPPEVR